MTGIYQILNKENGKRYIGQSTNLSHRKSCHIYDLKNSRHKNTALQQDYNKSSESFVFEVLCKCNFEQLDGLEIFFIQKYKADNPSFGYNVSPGAGLVSESTLKAMSDCKKGNKSMRGIKLSDEWKHNLSMAQPHKKRIECVETKETFESFADAARKTGICRPHIVSVCTGRRKTAGGFHFRYADKGKGD